MFNRNHPQGRRKRVSVLDLKALPVDIDDGHPLGAVLENRVEAHRPLRLAGKEGARPDPNLDALHGHAHPVFVDREAPIQRTEHLALVDLVDFLDGKAVFVADGVLTRFGGSRPPLVRLSDGRDLGCFTSEEQTGRDVLHFECLDTFGHLESTSQFKTRLE